MYSLNFSTVASRRQSGSNHIFHISMAGIEIELSLSNLFSPHMCEQDPLIALPLCNATAQRSQDPFLLPRSDYACVSRPSSETN